MAGKGNPKGVGGRAVGVKNKATVQKEIILAEVNRRMKEALVDTSSATANRDLAIDVLGRLMRVAEGACSVFKPTTAEQIAQGATANPQGNWSEFLKWIAMTRTIANDLAQYQTPKLQAIAVATPPPEMDEKQRTKRFTLTVFEGGKPLERKDVA